MTQEENQNVLEAEILDEVTASQPKLTVNPAKFIKRMMAGGWRMNSGKKNLSPNRVEKRRKKNKAARKSRRR
jgi:hypothetical protein